MASIFEELMNSTSGNLTESVKTKKKSAKKLVSAVTRKKISCKNIKVESMRILEDTDDFAEIDQQFETTPEDAEASTDEVVLVIDPELDSEEEVPENAAEEMVGDLIYKCPICGSNYVCDCDNLSEDMEVDEEGVPTTCPVCGDEAEQILIGEIAPADEAPGEEVDETEPVEVEDEEEIDVEDDGDDLEFDEEEDEEIEEESVRRPSRRLTRRTESRRPVGKRRRVSRTEASRRASALRRRKMTECDTVKKEEDDLEFDEVKYESLVRSIIRENYEGTPKFKITKVTSRGSKLTLEYVVRESRTKTTRGKMIGEGFNPRARKMRLEFKDQGAFTKKSGKSPAFVVECIKVRNTIIPTSIKYDYKVRVNEGLFRVVGKVGNRK